MSKTQHPMPELLDVPSLVESLGAKAAPLQGQLATDALRAALQDALASGQAVVQALALRSDQRRPADQALDRGWSGLDKLLLGVTLTCSEGGPTPLSGEEAARAHRAALLRARWVGGDLRFLALPFHAQWRESQLRLARLDEPLAPEQETTRQALEGLGLGWALERLVRLHKAYGDALGITQEEGQALALLRAWEAALDKLLSGVHYHHREDAALHAAIFDPYGRALEAGRARRREARAAQAPAEERSP